MKISLDEFLNFFFEYSLIPLVLWLFTYIPKKLNHDSNQDASETKIKYYGFEFVLIECITFFSLFFRINGMHELQYQPILSKASVSLGALLFLIFLYGLLKNKTVSASSVSDIYISFNFFLLSFWSRIWVILFCTSEFEGGYFNKIHITLFSLLYLMGLTTSYILLRRYLRKYLITWHSLLLGVQSLIADEQWNMASKKAKRLLQFYSKQEQTLDSHQAQVDIMTVWCRAIFKDENTNTAYENIRFIESFLEKRFVQLHDTTVIKNTLMALHLLCSKFSQAEINKKVDKYYKDRISKKAVKELIRKKNYKDFFPY